jgi:hypothetical protein
MTESKASPSTALIVASLATEGGAMTVAQMKANRELMKQVMTDLMEPGVHYGIIKGTDKPTLLKPGAELLCVVFRVDAKPHVEDLGDEDLIRYRVTMEGIHIPTTQVIAHGLGEASTDEEKYKWRACYNSREWDTTPFDRQRIKYGYNRQERTEFETKQVRTNPADAANTILKMAKKRAHVDLVMSFSACSDVFAQDMEDIAGWLKEVPEDAPPPAGGKRNVSAPAARKPAASSGGQPQSGKVNEGQLSVLRESMDRAGVSDKAITDRYGIADLADMPFDKLNDALMYCKKVHDPGADGDSGK